MSQVSDVADIILLHAPFTSKIIISTNVILKILII